MINKDIQEDYVSSGIAKLLNQKGFEGEVIKYYLIHEDGFVELFDKIYEFSLPEDAWIPAPTLNVACKWIREKYNIHILPYFDKIQTSDLPYSFVIYIVDEYAATREITACFDIDEDNYWGKPEQAIEAGILYVLGNLNNII